ncbi:hypothetical protein F0U60_33160 [Archangium minus]|uniref:Uncharacterized protein n=1 Tax=Archangium minus TaxID=83450 RepID=A0ABY9WZ78_9BACT|nr:hypothetical protein F0U60_33160 [Archangium minus]
MKNQPGFTRLSSLLKTTLAYDSDIVGLFELLKDNTVVSSRLEGLAPYDWYLDTAALANGVYTLRATATSTAAAGGDVNTVSLPITLQN